MRLFIGITIIFSVLTLNLSSCRENKRNTYNSVVSKTGTIFLNPFEAVDLIQNSPSSTLTILDVRTPSEIEKGSVEGAIHLNFYDPDFDKKISTLDPNTRYLLYCQSGSRARKAAEILRSQGVGKIYLLKKGGYADLRAAGAPTTR